MLAEAASDWLGPSTETAEGAGEGEMRVIREPDGEAVEVGEGAIGGLYEAGLKEWSQVLVGASDGESVRVGVILTLVAFAGAAGSTSEDGRGSVSKNVIVGWLHHSKSAGGAVETKTSLLDSVPKQIHQTQKLRRFPVLLARRDSLTLVRFVRKG